MVSHPNRSKRDADRPGRNPKPDEVKAAREATGLSQTEAGRVIYCSLRAWQDWESGARPMHPAFWELWRLKIAEGAAQYKTKKEGDTP